MFPASLAIHGPKNRIGGHGYDHGSAIVTPSAHQFSKIRPGRRERRRPPQCVSPSPVEWLGPGNVAFVVVVGVDQALASIVGRQSLGQDAIPDIRESDDPVRLAVADEYPRLPDVGPRPAVADYWAQAFRVPFKPVLVMMLRWVSLVTEQQQRYLVASAGEMIGKIKKTTIRPDEKVAILGAAFTETKNSH